MEIMSSQYLTRTLKVCQRRVRLRYIHRKKTKTVRLGGGGSPVRTWKIRVNARKVKIVLSSPLKLLKRLKNLYMNMMIKLGGGHEYGNVFGEKRVPKGRHLPIAYSTADFNNRLLLEIYKSMVASREMSTI